MKVVFLSNYFNHHQKSFSDAMYKLSNGQYVFVETEKMTQERKELGWGNINKPCYVLNNFESEEKRICCQKIIDEADVVIVGSAPKLLIKNRLKNKLLTFYYSERIYKEKKRDFYKYPVRLLRHLWQYARHKNLYLLCASAYTAKDFSKTFSFIGKTYKWGYFPETKKYENIDDLIEKKKKNSLLWVARFIELKHPETPILIAKRLRDDGYDFKINLIGCGEKEQEIKDLIKRLGVQETVNMLGSTSPEQVRKTMEESEIFLFTSDRREGWGAVLNESMNSACAVVASHAIGSVPFLIKDKENGLIYKDCDLDGLYEKVKFLLDNPKTRKEISKKAYETISLEWNAEKAAERFLILFERLCQGEKYPEVSKRGVCSKAKILKDNWYKNR